MYVVLTDGGSPFNTDYITFLLPHNLLIALRHSTNLCTSTRGIPGIKRECINLLGAVTLAERIDFDPNCSVNRETSLHKPLNHFQRHTDSNEVDVCQLHTLGDRPQCENKGAW